MTIDGESLNVLKEKANQAFKNKDFELTFSLSEKLAGENVPSALFTCGLIMENGWLNGNKNLDLALEFYNKLAINFNDDEGYLGCVRIFLAKHELDNLEKAEIYCNAAIKGRLKRLAYLLQGRIYEEFYDPPRYKLARKSYLRSFFSGSAWALRKYAESLMDSRNVFLGVIVHIIATIVSPVFVLFGGLKTTRVG